MASNENGYLGGMMVSYPFRDIEPSTVNDCFGSGTLVPLNVGFQDAISLPEQPVRVTTSRR